MIIFIPIKQNSQRVPKKNFRVFKSAPLYKHVLRKFNKHNVFVDTDSQQILEECKKDKSLSHVHAFSSPCVHVPTILRLHNHHVSTIDRPSFAHRSTIDRL